MNAVAFDQYGRPADVLKQVEQPTPTPGRGEVLVKMIAAPINPSDLLYIEGRYGLLPKSFPCVPGFEGVGVVTANGGGLLGSLRKGQRVAVLNDRIGNWAEYTVASAKMVYPVSDEVSDEQAAGFFVNPMTAIAMTRHVLKIPHGAWLLQSAAGSALGKMILKLAKRDGFKTINVVRRAEQAAELRALGADAVVVEGQGSIPEQVQALTGGEGARYAIDPVGGATGTAVVQSLANGGRCLLYGLLSGEPVAVDPRWLISGSKIVEGFWLADWAKKQGILTMLGLMREIRGLLVNKTFETQFTATYTLGNIREAVEHAAKPGKGGKVLLKLS